MIKIVPDKSDDGWSSAWIVREKDNKTIGQMDWSLGSDLSEEHPCKLNNNDIFLHNMDVYPREQRKGYGRAAMNKKHSDWLSEGIGSISLSPVAISYRLIPDEIGMETQKELVDWYKRQGYQKSNKCQHKPNCDNDLTCYLTKTLF